MILSKITWNPSVGIDLSFFVIHYYSLMFAVAFGLGFQLMKRIYINENQKMEHLESIFTYSIIATIIGARLGHVLFYQPELFKNDFFSILLPVQFNPKFKFTGFQGLASHGAAIAFIIAMYIYSKKVIKKPALWTLDRVTIPAAFGGIFVRLGNFFNSEIIGKKTDFITGVRFVQRKFSDHEASQITGIQKTSKAYDAIVKNPKYKAFLDQVDYSHPAQLYEAFGYIFVSFILLFLYWKTDKKNNPGFLFGTYMLLIFFVRFLVEYVKKSQGGFENILGILSTGQWLSIPFMAIGTFFLWNSKNKRTV